MHTRFNAMLYGGTPWVCRLFPELRRRLFGLVEFSFQVPKFLLEEAPRVLNSLIVDRGTELMDEEVEDNAGLKLADIPI